MDKARSTHLQEHVVVLGGGIAGLSAADSLSKAGMRVTVIEERDACGGTHRSRSIGPYTFDVGSIFYESSARLFNLAPGLREMCPQIIRRQRRIAPGGTLAHYPLEPREFLRRAPRELVAALIDLAVSRCAVRRDGSLAAISTQRLGKRFFAQTGLRSYITRFHHVPPEEVSESFFLHRMAFIEKATRPREMARLALRALLSRGSVAGRPRPALHVRPREGYAPLFAAITDRLAERGVDIRTATALRTISASNGTYRIETDHGSLEATAVVSALPLDTLHRALFGAPSGLTSLGMTTLYVSAAQLSPDTGNVLFNFDTRGRWKRATIYSRIYPEPQMPREFFAVECTLPPGGEHAPQDVFADFRDHLSAVGLARDLRLEGHEHVPDCYPLYRPGTEAILQDTLARIEEQGIVLAGRQGRFEYLPTSSGVIRRVGEELARAALPVDPVPPDEQALCPVTSPPPGPERSPAGGLPAVPSHS
ncbi:protoporphyrinogen/coproporphyrinogen oxidase [Novosphingobium mangrovi (ex Hu et al. 2023)]|uniref:FAD-dependent oxidoreductase n=1 Tax=Novosphingobium mangrovi (ex Hu et al. 2023) TaxID=2930094 RepID=A0ABT0AHT2_9SPHN|nr:FAD-dependent oxidoreductase [Novosphingobium mangrovi (ex Hu et al. 2023)]MCJ1962758.1 FAD-dependent oxidoreductase [Novosphingobium mangrovi (ex Hu et al. 2023)]